MSYCRWSSDDFRCDVYAYEDIHGGWTIHLAGNRFLGDIPPIIDVPHPEDGQEAADRWYASYKAQAAFLSTAKREPIGLPFAGQSFNLPTLDDFLEKLIELRGLGYNFPDYVLESVREEIAAGRAALKGEGE